MPNILEVSALNRYVRSLFEGDPFLNDIAVRGEISNFYRNHKTGHCYFSLVDAKNSVKAVLFSREAQRLGFRPADGMDVVARGRVSLYERDGAYQLYVDALFEQGQGEQKLAFELLKEKLAAQGLFSPDHKKPLPPLVNRIGLVTSKTGAALQDILQVSQRRNPCVSFLLALVSVQGDSAASEIAAALKAVDALALDVIILARGGGAAEDLSAFNDERIVRSIYDAKTPVISAVGHEIDFTLADFVADIRASTPSAAAELAVADVREKLRAKEILCREIGRNIHKKWNLCYNEIRGFRRHASFAMFQNKMSGYSAQLRQLSLSIERAQHQKLQALGKDLQAAALLAESLNPYGVLARGYAVVEKEGKALRSAKETQKGDLLTLRLADGSLQTEVMEVYPRGKGTKDE
ncbi:exodeoxyribonuclease VII large subunit [Ruminococcaceae bacterium OttesenSCG-928-I18]|nr:exodeoxyribonuclease VII large subunit [Ruminococcaceae bacterium OttesenSCG-928-I18]